MYGPTFLIIARHLAYFPKCRCLEQQRYTEGTPDRSRDYLDGLEKPELKEKLRLMSGLNDEYGYRAAVDAMTMSLKNGDVNSSDATIIAQRITGYGIDTPPESGPSLEVYDRAFLGPGREDEAS